MSKFVLNSKEELPVIDEKLNKCDRAQKKDETCEKFYRKARKLYDRFIKSQITVFSKNNSVYDLLIRTEEELALITNFRVSQYNEKMKSVTKFYNKLK
jgi:hypothetical protein